ncbi:imidazole glycerol phosphate synthase, glutamine amidotransferase subunit, partial [candidate division WOR-1 bacterium RIFOXYA2_FULL_37_7]
MLKPQVGIIDYDMGNMFSVLRACEQVDLLPVLISNKKDMNICDAVILPGVGAFAKAMENLKKLDLICGIRDFIASDKPFMGICLGMQLLFSESEEFGKHKGLDIIKGVVKRFSPKNERNNIVKVPQVGWNKLNFNGKFSIFNDIKDGEYMYFVHSYYVVPENKKDIATTTNYADIDFCSSVVSGNVMAFQFHPEKSAGKGLQIYRN